MSDDNSSPESVSDPEDTQEGATKEARAPLGEAPPPPRAKGGSSTLFIVGFAVLLAIVAALVIFFVVRGLNPSDTGNTTLSSMPDDFFSQTTELPISEFPVSGANGEETTQRARMLDSLPEPFYTQLAFDAARPNAKLNSRCPHETYTLNQLVFEVQSWIFNKQPTTRRRHILTGSDPTDHFMVDLTIRLNKRDLRSGRRAYLAIVLPQTKDNATLVYAFDNCMKKPIQVGLLENIDPHLPRVRRRVSSIINEHMQHFAELSCNGLTDPQDDSRIVVRTLLDMSYGGKHPQLTIVNCKPKERRCSVLYKIESGDLQPQLMTPMSLFLFAGHLPSSGHNYRQMARRRSPVLDSSLEVQTWCMSGDISLNEPKRPYKQSHGIDDDIGYHLPGFIPPKTGSKRKWFN